MSKCVSVVVLISTALNLYAANYSPKENGDWSNPGIWRDNSSGTYGATTVLPSEGDSVILNYGDTLSLDVDAHISLLTVVNSSGVKGGTLNLDHPKSLKTPLSRVGHPEFKGKGLINITQGAFDMDGRMTVYQQGSVLINGGILGNIFDQGERTFDGPGTITLNSGRFSMLGSAENSKVYFDIGLIEVKGGAFESARTVFGQRSTAELRIVGDKGLIRFKSLFQGSGKKPTGLTPPYGTFRFVFNASGISPVVVEEQMALSGIKLIVDGSDYFGGPKTFTLFKAAIFRSFPIDMNVEVIGFGVKGKDWRLIRDRTRGVLEIAVK